MEEVDYFDEKVISSLRFNIEETDSINWDRDEIVAIYDGKKLMIKGEEEFVVGADCPLANAVYDALKWPFHVGVGRLICEGIE